MERHDDRDELKNAPTLRGLPEQDPFVVPAGFFDRFPSMMQERIAAEHGPAKSGIMERFARLLRQRIVIGSLSAAALVTIIWMAWPGKVQQGTISMAIEPEEVLDERLDPETLYSALGDEGTLMSSVELPADQNELLAYLENEDLTLDQLIEDL